jgi:hypothetical protein
MLLKHSPKAGAHERDSAGIVDDRWRLTDLEAAQRRNLYAAGRGDGRKGGARRRWALKRSV